MSVEPEVQPRRSVPSGDANISNDHFEISSASLPRDARDVLGSSLRLSSLLSSAPVDLARVGTEIRTHPDLETLILRLAASLVLSAGITALTIEEAAVVLGTDRLRVLIYMWSLAPDGHSAAEVLRAAGTERSDTGGDRPTSSGASPARNPETLYLASFLRWLGLDSPARTISPDGPPCFAAGLQSEDIAGLMDLLMRDFVALMPVLAPAIRKLRQFAASSDTGGTRATDEA